LDEFFSFSLLACHKSGILQQASQKWREELPPPGVRVPGGPTIEIGYIESERVKKIDFRFMLRFTNK